MNPSSLPNDIQGLLSRLNDIDAKLKSNEEEGKRLRGMQKSIRNTVEMVTGEALPGSSLSDERVEAHLTSALREKAPQSKAELLSSTKAFAKETGGSENGLALSVSRVLKRKAFIESGGSYRLASQSNAQTEPSTAASQAKQA